MTTCKSYCLRFTHREPFKIEDAFFFESLEDAKELFESYSCPFYSAEDNISVALIEIDWYRRADTVLDIVCF